MARKIQFFSLCQPPKKWFRHEGGVLPFAAPSGCPQPLVHLCPARSGLRQARDNGTLLGDLHAQRCQAGGYRFLAASFQQTRPSAARRGDLKFRQRRSSPSRGLARRLLASSPGPRVFGRKAGRMCVSSRGPSQPLASEREESLARLLRKAPSTRELDSKH